MGDDAKAPKKGKAKPPQLPKDAPQDVKDFVDCKSDKVTLDPTKKGFLPEIPVIGAPDVTVAPVAGKPGTAKVTLKKTGLLDTSFTLTVTNGHLAADTTGVTPQLVKDAIDRWVKRYNDWLDANNRKLDGLSVDKGTATVTKVPAGAAGGAGGTGGAGTAGQGGEGKGGGIKKAVGAGTAAVLLGAGTYLGIQVFGSEDGGTGDRPPSSDTSAPDAQGDTGSGSGAGSGAGADGLAPVPYTCDPAAQCGTPYNALFQGVGTATTHDGSPADPDAPSNTRLVGLTTWTGPIGVTADCAFGPTTGQAVPDPEGVFRIDLPLYSYGPCELTDLTLRDDLTFSDAIPFRALDVLFTWEVQSTPTEVDPATLQNLADDWGLLDVAAAVDAKVVADALTGRDLCYLEVFLPDAAGGDLGRLCSRGQWIHGLQVALPSLDPTVTGMYAVGGAQISGLDSGLESGLDSGALEELVGDGGRFPCGVGDLAVTLCPDRAPDPGTDSALLVQTVVAEDRADAPVVFDLGGGASVSVTTGTDGSRMDVTGDVQPYVIIRNQTMSVLVPGHRAEVFGVDDGPEVAPWPPIPYAGQEPAAPEPETPTPEAVRAFARDLAASLASADKSFARDHLDPAVLQLFPAGCEEHLAGLRDPTYAIERVRLGAVGPFTYAPPSAGGASVEVAEVLTVRARVTQDGRTRSARLHFGTRAPGLSWFTDCGPDPDDGG